MAHVVAQEAYREHAPAPARLNPACGVQGEHVESHGIARLQRPAQDAVSGRLRVAAGLDVGQFGQRARRKPARLVRHEGARHQPGAAMRAGSKLQRGRAADRVHGDPEAHVLCAVHVVVRLVLMPGRGLARAWLLGQHVVVVQAGGTALHQPAGHGRQRGSEDELAVGTVVLPVAEVLDEEAGVFRLAGHQGTRAGRCQIGIDALAQQRQFRRRQQAAQHHGAVRGKGLHRGLVSDGQRARGKACGLGDAPFFDAQCFGGLGMCGLGLRGPRSQVHGVNSPESR